MVHVDINENKNATCLCLLVFSALESLHSVMFYLVCLVPMCVAALQVLAWRPFSIRNSHTVDIKYTDS